MLSLKESKALIHRGVRLEKEDFHTYRYIQNNQMFIKLQNEDNGREIHHRYSASTKCPFEIVLFNPV